MKFKKKKVVDPLTEFSVPIEEFEAIVKNVISSYNASAHSYFGVATTPNEVEEERCRAQTTETVVALGCRPICRARWFSSKLSDPDASSFRNS